MQQPTAAPLPPPCGQLLLRMVVLHSMPQHALTCYISVSELNTRWKTRMLNEWHSVSPQHTEMSRWRWSTLFLHHRALPSWASWCKPLAHVSWVSQLNGCLCCVMTCWNSLTSFQRQQSPEGPCENAGTIKFTSFPASHLPSPLHLFSTWVDAVHFFQTFPNVCILHNPKDRTWCMLMLIFTFSNVDLQEIHCSCAVGCQELWELLTAFAISWRNVVIAELHWSGCDTCCMQCPSCRASSVD